MSDAYRLKHYSKALVCYITAYTLLLSLYNSWYNDTGIPTKGNLDFHHVLILNDNNSFKTRKFWIHWTFCKMATECFMMKFYKLGIHLWFTVLILFLLSSFFWCPYIASFTGNALEKIGRSVEWIME